MIIEACKKINRWYNRVPEPNRFLLGVGIIGSLCVFTPMPLPIFVIAALIFIRLMGE